MQRKDIKVSGETFDKIDNLLEKHKGENFTIKNSKNVIDKACI
jgi:hypothetical protein